ncbi:SDR family oxidoreductase [Streptomyces sp. NPDC052236]|uniref:SDR family oxidoreductase n=1 Tax=Streptomyces sp. NPDC052236 TaxID=3365686 RepID=UPI0037CD1561
MDSTILVTGATGTLGRRVVERLLADGARVRVMSRRPRPEGDDRPYEWAPCDLAKEKGLDAAVQSVSTIVHCATDGRNDVEGTRRLVKAARGAGNPHLVYISIVGIEKVPFFYYNAKLAAERLVMDSGLPWTILRATQFHDLMATMTTAQRRLPVVLVPSGLRFQPIEVTEVAERLAELAQGAPAGRVPDLAGPEVRHARALADATLRAAGRHRLLVPLRLPGKTFRGFRSGGHLAPDRAVGKVTYEQYLAARARAGRL